MMRRLLCRLCANCPGALGIFARQRCFPGLFASCGRGVLFGRGLHFAHPERVRIGDGAILSHGCRFEGEGEVLLGEKVFVGVRTRLVAHGLIELRTGANIGNHCELETRHGLRIGEHTLLAAYVHVEEDGAGEKAAETVLGEGCWLGVRVRVTGGSRIGSGTIVGAHATVCGELPAQVIAVGDPAREMKKRV